VPVVIGLDLYLAAFKSILFLLDMFFVSKSGIYDTYIKADNKKR